MLNRAHVRPFQRVAEGRVHVEYLRDVDGRVAGFLDWMCALVRRLEGASYATVVEALRRQERRVRDASRLAGIAKSLLDACEFAPPPGAERSAEVRAAVFRARGSQWPPMPADRRAPYEAAARALSLSVSDVEALLYADVPSARRLVRASSFDGRALIARYNLDLARAVLLGADRVTLTARGGWRAIFRALKVARLMYTVTRSGRSYRIELTGPAGAYIKRTTRYGARFARIVPALSRAPSWRLDAAVSVDGTRARFRVSGRARARSGAAPLGAMPARPSYDSAWERRLASDLRTLIRDEATEWSLAREATPVVVGGSVFLPDFTLRHEDGREALVEVVGFWTPEYLEEKARKVSAARLANLVLVVRRDLAVGAAPVVDQLTGGELVWFSGVPKAGDVLSAAERCAVRA